MIKTIKLVIQTLFPYIRIKIMLFLSIQDVLEVLKTIFYYNKNIEIKKTLVIEITNAQLLE